MIFLLCQAVDRAAQRFPDRDAARFLDQSVTYADLARRSNGLARVLIDQGVRRGDRVGILMNKSLHCPVAIHGIMKAGAAYVPLDPGAPPSRLRFVIQDCGIRHLVCEPKKAKLLGQILSQQTGLECIIGIDPPDLADAPNPPSEIQPRVVSWDQVRQLDTDTLPGPGAGAGASPGAGVGTIEQDLAYVLYTSGSTGTPKGIIHTHRSALAFAEMAADVYGLTHEDRISNYAPMHFDLSTLDYFSCAVVGATMVMIPEIYTKIPASLSMLLEDHRLTVFYCVPLALTQLALHGALDKRDLSSLRWVLFGGEPMPVKHLRNLMAQLPDTRFANIYGPTETNGCTHYVVPQLPADRVDEDDPDDPLPIGHPYPNVDYLIVDENDQPAPPGTPGTPGATGELLIRTPTMMQGYWGRADLNAKCGYRVPVMEGYEKVYHRTGDLVRVRPDGEIAFLGRKDRQIKTRGHRVELDEVEFVILSHEQIDEAATYTIPDDSGSLMIVAAVIGHDHRVDKPDLMRHLAAHLPHYAVPQRVEVVEDFPRTSTGKIDRRTLQQRAMSSIHDPDVVSTRG